MHYSPRLILRWFIIVVVIGIFLHMAGILVWNLDISVSRKQEDLVYNVGPIPPILPNQSSPSSLSQSTQNGTGDCTMMSCAVMLAQQGMDVIPRENRWTHVPRWEKISNCGEPFYYIVEVRFAVLDTFAQIDLGNIVDRDKTAIGVRVSAVNSSMSNMSEFTEPTYSNGTILHGVDFDDQEMPCVSATGSLESSKDKNRRRLR